jgi:hypothetical protein
MRISTLHPRESIATADAHTAFQSVSSPESSNMYRSCWTPAAFTRKA